MKSADLVIKGYARQCDGVWIAVCLDFGLAAQGDTLELAMASLHDQIGEYVYDVLAGDDKEHAAHLLTARKAPLSQWMTYYKLRVFRRLFLIFSGSLLKDGVAKIFNGPLPLPLALPNHHHVT